MPPTSAFFSTMVKGMPACFSRMPASSPDMPAPTITTGSFAAAAFSFGALQSGRFGSMPVICSSSIRKGA